MKALGEKIKAYRDEHKLSLREFAELCGVSHSYIDKLEKGVDQRSGKPVEPTLDVIEKIASAMGLTLGQLLTQIGKIDPEKDLLTLEYNINGHNVKAKAPKANLTEGFTEEHAAEYLEAAKALKTLGISPEELNLLVHLRNAGISLKDLDLLKKLKEIGIKME
jgi:transcriptional regulator with XRE-family HTH domain